MVRIYNDEMKERGNNSQEKRVFIEWNQKSAVSQS
jgi:hypothetical protein